MALEQNVFINDVWRQVGKKERIDTYTTSLRPTLVTTGEYGLLLHWPRSLRFLSIGASHGERKPFKSFGRGRQAFELVARTVGARTPDPRFFEEAHVLVAQVKRTDTIVIHFVVDTDEPDFSHRAEEALKREEKDLRVVIGLMAFDAIGNEEGQINLVLAPAIPVVKYEGYVALDVGNTASTLVCLPTGVGQPQTTTIQVLDANEERAGTLKDNADPVLSHVRIDWAENFSDNPFSVRWLVGRIASTGTDGLVVGPKRLVACKDWEETQVFNSQQRVALPRRVPAELLVCKMLQRFREATSCQPEAIAITYPTTYEPRELKQLREVVYRGYQRSRWRKQDGARDEHNVRSRIPVVLDEASAAAFFFLYRRILESPGGLPRFRFLYPGGLNLLLYDCGGGTTDIALVNAASEPGSGRLVIGVKARTGLRGFGGDNITVAVCRILKAKLAFEINRLMGGKDKSMRPFPDKAGATSEEAAAELENYLVAPRFDRFVPTMFATGGVNDDTSRQRRNYALDLWQWAETLKCKLETSSSASLGGDVAGGSRAGTGSNQTTLWDYLRKDFSADNVREKQAIAALQQIKVNRWEVDCLVRAQLDKSIENCNELIRKRLTEAGQEVHWVVASGNGARYPLIQELLKQRLDVQFIEDGRFTLDIDNLKHAVAKGAVLYLMALRAQKKLQVEFDTDLSNCLPFDVVYHDPVTNTYPILFHEHDRYDKISAEPPRRLEGAPGDTGSFAAVDTRLVELARRWPGDGESYSPYLRFEFEQMVQFPVEVTFDIETWQFKVTDSSGAIGAMAEESDRRIYESPVQRGDM